jgi:putative ABC transport system permease protein
MNGLIDLFLQTLGSLRAHALRFSLTSLGIFWGAVMLTYLSATMAGQEKAFGDQLELTGPKSIWVIPGVIVKSQVGERGARQLVLEPVDVDRIEALDVIESSSVVMNLWNRVVRSGDRTRLLTVVGLDADGARIRNYQVEAGRLLANHDVDRSAKVAFLGASAKERVFGRRPAVGRTIHIEGVPFRVIGVAVKKGEQLMYMGDADDNLVLIPRTTAVRHLEYTDVVTQFIADPRTRYETGRATEGVRSVLSVHHGFDPSSDLAVNFISVEEIWQLLDGLFGALKLFFFATGVVTLLVGGVGVMNIMLVVVGERVQEIGLRKALGASDRAIFLLFLSEAMAVSLISGVAGALTGYVLVHASTAAARAAGQSLPDPLFNLEIIVVIVVSLVLVGVVSGLVPAIRGAKIPPAESLRSVS